ncbi:helix-turn-helix domain-containing protein [Lactobacillus crispatus]|uniref:Rgg family transcriptional regulator n=1 Tax=Lactobacillus crispatus TaxID=47770 RepID=UPI0022E674B2|nr:helix-turn-helix domain-containing protein [Lactobacillus crispatus]
MFKYGSIYKQLRKDQEITQTEACKGICSISKLSRWENNQVEVEFSTAIALLRRINITLDEFTHYAAMKTEFTLPDDIITAIKGNDTKVLDKFVQEQLNHYHANKNILELKNIILVCNQLFLMTGKNYLTPADINRIGSYLLHNTVWSKYNILLFANSPFLLNSKIGYQIALRIIHNFHPTESLNENTTIFMGGLSDTVIASVFKKKLDYAQKILNELKKIELPFYLMFFSSTLTLLQKIIDYCHTLNAQPVLAMIDAIVKLNCMEVAQKWLEIFKDVQQIWPEKEN